MLYDDYAAYTQEHKKRYGDRTVVLMEEGSFWELYDCDRHLGADMKEICGLLNITLSRKNKNIVEVSSANPQMAGFPSHALGKFLPVLIDDDWTVVLVGQVTPPPNPKRDIIGIYSKGTYIADGEVVDRGKSNSIMCVVYDENVDIRTRVRALCVGVAVVDVTIGDTRVYELYGCDCGELEDTLYKFFLTEKPSEFLAYTTSNSNSACGFYAMNSRLLERVKSNGCIVHDYTTLGRDSEISHLNFQNVTFAKAYPNTNVGLLTLHEVLGLEHKVFAASALCALLRYVINHDPRLIELYLGSISAQSLCRAARTRTCVKEDQQVRDSMWQALFCKALVPTISEGPKDGRILECNRGLYAIVR